MPTPGCRMSIADSPNDGVRCHRRSHSVTLSVYRTRHRPRDPRAAADRDQDLLRLQHALRRAAEHAYRVRCAWAARRAAGAEPRAPSSSPCAPRSRSAAPSTASRSSRARTTSIRTCPRATRSPSTTGRSRPAARSTFDDARRDAARGHRPRPHGRGRRQVAARRISGFRSAHRARLQPQRRAADRDRHRARPSLGRRCRASASAACARSWSPSASTTATWKRAASAATRTSRSVPPGDGARRQDRDQEPQLVPLRPAGASSTRSSGRRRRRQRARRSSRRRGCGTPAPAARSRCAARKRRTTTATSPSRTCRRCESTRRWIDEIRRDAARAARGAAPALRRAVRRCPTTMPALLTQSRGAGRRISRRRPRPAGNAEGGEQLDHGGADPEDERARRRRSRTCRLTPEALAGLIRLVDSGTISGPIAKGGLRKDVRARAATAAAIVEAEGLARIDDEAAVEAAVRDVARRRTRRPVEQYRAGKRQTFGFLVGQVMKASGGKAEPGARQRDRPA